MIPELDIELVQTVDLRKHHLKKVGGQSDSIKEIVIEEAVMSRPNKASAAAAAG